MTSGGKIFVDNEGVVRCCGGRRVEGVELVGEVPECGGEVKVRLEYPVLTDEGGKVDGVDMTVAENRKRLHNEKAGITESDEKELKGRMSNQQQHSAFALDRGKKEGGGKRWKHGGKWEEPLDPTVVHDTPKFPLGSVMVDRGVKGGC